MVFDFQAQQVQVPAHDPKVGLVHPALLTS